LAVQAEHAESVTLLPDSCGDLLNPIFTFRFDVLRDKSGRISHCHLPSTEIGNACYYAPSPERAPRRIKNSGRTACQYLEACRPRQNVIDWNPENTAERGFNMSETVDPVWGLRLSVDELEQLRAEVPSPPSFPSLEEVPSLAADDLECFAEIKEVLKKHNKLDRFGITLLHSHFDMRPNEVLLERTNTEERRMVQEPEIIDTCDITAIDTQWYLGQSMPLSLVKCRTSMHS
jgi:hypothetical protein